MSGTLTRKVTKKLESANGKSAAFDPAEITSEDIVRAYRTMLLARKLDNKMLTLLKQGKGFFHIGSSGHEAIQIAAAKAMIPGKDWAYPYYRDLAFSLQYGMTVDQTLLPFFGRADDITSGGRQMPMHYSHPELRIVSQSSPTGSQYLQAVGCALGARKAGTDEVVYVSSGEGATSQGDFHEALNWSSRDKLPVIFVIEDNQYAISVPVHQQTSEGVYYLAQGYKGLKRVKVDGTDFIRSYETMQQAVKRARAGQGPSIIVANVVRLLPHSSSDDHSKYRPKEDLENDTQRDPIKKIRHYLTAHQMATTAQLDTLADEIKKTVDEASAKAEQAHLPDPATVDTAVYSPELSPVTGNPKFDFESDAPVGEPVVIVDALNHALMEELQHDENVIMFGQDIQDKKGGVFTVTKGLSTKFGLERVFNAPLAESSIVGVAIGLAVRGYKPVVEIQFGDYIWTAFMQIRNELATMRYRSNNTWKCPLVIRVPVGGYIHGGLCHSQNIEAFFSHIPGILLALPSNAADAKGLLKSAIRGDDPVIFMEHKGLYRQGFAKSPEPGPDYLLPFGQAGIKKAGRDLSIITYGMTVQRSLEAVKLLEAKHPGISVEVIDIRTIIPLDREAILNSIKKTSRALVVHEDTKTAGFGAEIASIIASDAFEWLDAPVKRVAAKDTPTPFSVPLEAAALPQVQDILHAAEFLLEY